MYSQEEVFANIIRRITLYHWHVEPKRIFRDADPHYWITETEKSSSQFMVDFAAIFDNSRVHARDRQHAFTRLIDKIDSYVKMDIWYVANMSYSARDGFPAKRMLFRLCHLYHSKKITLEEEDISTNLQMLFFAASSLLDTVDIHQLECLIPEFYKTCIYQQIANNPRDYATLTLCARNGINLEETFLAALYRMSWANTRAIFVLELASQQKRNAICDNALRTAAVHPDFMDLTRILAIIDHFPLMSPNYLDAISCALKFRVLKHGDVRNLAVLIKRHIRQSIGADVEWDIDIGLFIDEFQKWRGLDTGP